MVYNASNNIISILFYFFIDGKSKFFGGKNFFFEVLVDGLNIIQFSQSKNEWNPKLLVYLVIYGCYGVFPASIELKKYNGNTLFRGRRLHFFRASKLILRLL